MPAGFAYLTAWLAYFGVALLLLLAALVLAMFPRFRSQAKWLALGVPGSIVGVFAFQAVALPIVIALIWTMLLPVGYFHGGGETTNPLIIALGICAALAATAFFAAASLAGFVLGWRGANALGARSGLSEFLASDRVWQGATVLFRRPYGLPFLLWLLGAWSVFGVATLRWWLGS